MATRDEIVGFCDELLEIGSFEDYGPNGLQEAVEVLEDVAGGGQRSRLGETLFKRYSSGPRARERL